MVRDVPTRVLVSLLIIGALLQNSFVPQMSSIAEELGRQLVSHANSSQEPVNILEWTTTATLSIISTCGFGIDMGSKASAIVSAPHLSMSLARTAALPWAVVSSSM